MGNEFSFPFAWKTNWTSARFASFLPFTILLLIHPRLNSMKIMPLKMRSLEWNACHSAQINPMNYSFYSAAFLRPASLVGPFDGLPLKLIFNYQQFNLDHFMRTITLLNNNSGETFLCRHALFPTFFGCTQTMASERTNERWSSSTICSINGHRCQHRWPCVCVRIVTFNMPCSVWHPLWASHSLITSSIQKRTTS